MVRPASHCKVRASWLPACSLKQVGASTCPGMEHLPTAALSAPQVWAQFCSISCSLWKKSASHNLHAVRQNQNPSLCPDFKGQMKKAGNALASFGSDVKILERTKCFLLLAFVYHCWEKRRTEQELSLHKRGAVVLLHCHRVTEMKHVTHLHWVSARTSPLLSELSVCWAGCCSTAGVTWFSLQWHRCCQFSVLQQ